MNLGLRIKLIFVLIVVFVYVVYGHSSLSQPTYFNHFVRLSERMLQGRVDMIDYPDYLERSLDERTGKMYVPYPPMPAVVLMPFVYLDVFAKNQSQYSFVFGGLTIGLFFLVCARMFNSVRVGVVLALCLSLGTSFWYLASDGSSWYISHVFAIFFLLIAFLTLQIREKGNYLDFSESSFRWLIAGIAVGSAYMTRDPTILAAFFFLLLPILRNENQLSLSKAALPSLLHTLLAYRRQYIAFLLPLVCSLCIIGYYNFIRFGTIKPVQHEHIPHLLELPIFDKGFLNVSYIPRNLTFFLTKTPLPYEHFPYFKPSLEGMSYLLVSPFMILLVFATWKKRWVQASFLTSILMLTVVFMNGSNGFSQFGYRYAMEATVFLLLIFGTVLKRKFWYLTLPFIIFAVLVNFWGIYFIRFLQISGW